jgi:hypothetical protein
MREDATNLLNTSSFLVCRQICKTQLTPRSKNTNMKHLKVLGVLASPTAHHSSGKVATHLFPKSPSTGLHRVKYTVLEKSLTNDDLAGSDFASCVRGSYFELFELDSLAQDVCSKLIAGNLDNTVPIIGLSRVYWAVRTDSLDFQDKSLFVFCCSPLQDLLTKIVPR